MNHKQVAERWREQVRDSGKGSRIFYEGKVIYSYGYHFPIAYIHESEEGEVVIFFNSDGYSVSTSKHKSIVWSVCSYDKVVEVNTETLKNIINAGGRFNNALINSVYFELRDRFNQYTTKESRARKGHTQQYWYIKAHEVEDQMATFNNLTESEGDTYAL